MRGKKNFWLVPNNLSPDNFTIFTAKVRLTLPASRAHLAPRKLNTASCEKLFCIVNFFILQRAATSQTFGLVNSGN